jgi:hypothetical protein
MDVLEVPTKLFSHPPALRIPLAVEEARSKLTDNQDKSPGSKEIRNHKLKKGRFPEIIPLYHRSLFDGRMNFLTRVKKQLADALYRPFHAHWFV